MNLSHTSDMELAVQRLAAQHHHTLIYRDHKVPRPIRLRLDQIEDTAITLIEGWRPEADKYLADWQLEGGAMVYTPRKVKRPTPKCDAMLIVECPMQYPEFEEITRDVRQEVVVYKPPMWDLHDEAMDVLYPPAGRYKMLAEVFSALVGRELDDMPESVLVASGMARDKAAVFTSDEIELFTGLTERAFRKAVIHTYRGRAHRYHIYRLNVRPKAPDMAQMYDWLEQETEVFRGRRAVRYNKIKHDLNSCELMLRYLYRGKYITREPCVYVMDSTRPPLDYEKLDAMGNFHKGRWFKMKNLINNSKGYLI